MAIPAMATTPPTAPAMIGIFFDAVSLEPVLLGTVVLPGVVLLRSVVLPGAVLLPVSVGPASDKPRAVPRSGSVQPESGFFCAAPPVGLTDERCQ